MTQYLQTFQVWVIFHILVSAWSSSTIQSFKIVPWSVMEQGNFVTSHA